MKLYNSKVGDMRIWRLRLIKLELKGLSNKQLKDIARIILKGDK